MNDRILIVSPHEESLLVRSTEFTRATSLGDAVVANGFIGKIAGFEVFVSNNLTEASSVRHLIAATRGVVSYAAQIKPVVETTPSSARTRFANLWKSQLLYGIKTFTEGANRMVDLQVTIV